MPRSESRADIAILGGGLAGLSAALAFGRRGRRVALLERDGPAGPWDDPDQFFDDWKRPGIAHFRQPHNFLGLARRVLLDEAPDVLDTILGFGAVENRQYELLPGDPEPEDEAFVSIWARRPLFEIALRRAVDAEANVEVLTNTRVVDLLAAPSSRRDGSRITGVRTSGGEAIETGPRCRCAGTNLRVGVLARLAGSPPAARAKS